MLSGVLPGGARGRVALWVLIDEGGAVPGALSGGAWCPVRSHDRASFDELISAGMRVGVRRSTTLSIRVIVLVQ